MGVFNFFIVIPQVVAGLIPGFFTTHFFHGESVLTLVLGGVSMIISGLLTLRVHDADDIHLPLEESAETLGYDALAQTNPQV